MTKMQKIRSKVLQKRNALVGMIALVVAVTPLALNRCGKGLDTDKTLTSPSTTVSVKPSVTPTPSVSVESPFNPTKIPGLVAWFRAEYFAEHAVQDGASLAGATWPNAASSTLGALIASGNPTFYQSSGPNQKPAVRFNSAGPDKFTSQNASGLSTSVTGFTGYVVAKNAVGTGSGLYWMSSLFPGGPAIALPTDDSMILGGGTTLIRAGYCRAVNFNSPTINLDNGFHLFKVTWENSSTYLVLEVSGSSAQSIVTNPGPVNLSGDFIVGFDGSNTMNGDIAEVLIWLRTLDQSEINTMNTYFRDKYGL